ncbi:helix-turn-helix domain-containing protein [Candidatus Woesebacteria bacterium]|nr:helix-turn-helix domain-containing protein [Candidatus Woesebacteria bacterium]
MKTSSYWKPSNIEEMWSYWLAPLRYGEPCMIVTYPSSDIIRRFEQLLENIRFIQKAVGSTKLSLRIVDYRIERWSTAGEMIRSILDTKTDDNLICLLGFESILADRRSDLIIALQDIYRNQRTKLLLVCEANYYDPQFENFLLSIPSFEPSVVIHGFYDEKLAVEFAIYLSIKWKMNLKPELIAEIVHAVGPSLRLIKSVMWKLRDQKDPDYKVVLESHEVIWQLRAIWHKLNINERKIMTDRIYGTRIGEESVMVDKYINDMGYTKVPLLAEYIKKYVGNPLEVKASEEMILIGGANYSDKFTGKQKQILKLVLASPGTFVKREDLIDALWGDSTLGSDWALDSQVNRLRQRLTDLGISSKHLITKRGQGLIWQSQ